jgi:tRNA A-37 threonylcarbamoyl transferase component Bud32
VSGEEDRPDRAKDESELPPLILDGSPPEEVALPASLGGRYETVSRLGTGAFGEVFRARDRVLGREVAVKRIRLDAFVETERLEEVKQRFLREAQVAARLAHPGIVTTHDIVSEPATSFIVMELVKGDTLQTILQERGRLPPAEALDIAEQVAAALDHAHSQGIIHRDIKPANIMVEASGHVRVMDFGIAKLDAGGNLTSTGLILGTPSYMSPEQARGRTVDARADVFSLGCVLYECVAGEKPFPAESITTILSKILTEAPAPLDVRKLGLPPALEGVLHRAMAKEPSQRFESAGQLVQAARQALEHGTEVAPAPRESTGTVVTAAVPEPDAPPGGRRGRWVPVAAGLGAAALVGAFVGVQALRAVTPPPSADGQGLVVEEPVGFFGRVLGREPRLLITVPAATTLRLELETPISSATSSVGDAFVAEVRQPVEVENVEAVGGGARVSGRLSNVTTAEEGKGRGALTLEFETVTLVDGRELDIEATPVVLRAPAPQRRRKKGFIAGLTEAGAAIGELIGGRKGAQAGAGLGAATGAGLAYSEAGADIELPAGSGFEVQLAAPVVVTRVREP